jgi:serine/threonine protein kinase
VLHHDVKSSNDLLDEDFEAELADFGHARVVTGGPAASHVSTQAADTAGQCPAPIANYSTADRVLILRMSNFNVCKYLGAESICF